MVVGPQFILVRNAGGCRRTVAVFDEPFKLAVMLTVVSLKTGSGA